MAKYEVIANEVSILKAHSTYTNDNGNVIGYDHESITYLKGAVIDEEDISPVVIKQFNDGDERTISLIRKLNLKPKNVKPKRTDDEPQDQIKESIKKEEVVNDEKSEKAEEVSVKEPNRSALPFSGYDELSVTDVISVLEKANAKQREAILVYEQENQARVTILEYKVKKGE